MSISLSLLECQIACIVSRSPSPHSEMSFKLAWKIKAKGFSCKALFQIIDFKQSEQDYSEEIKATKKRIHPNLDPLFNLTMQNKIDHANRILRLMDRYPSMTVGKRIVVSDRM